MRRRPIALDDLRGVFAVPPLARKRDSRRTIDEAQNARLVHHESASRGKALRPEQKARADRELAALRSRWADALLDDPYHSPNLSLSSKVPRLAWPPRERRPWSL